MDNNKLTEYLTQSFHSANFEVYTTALDLHFDFLEEGQLILVDVTEFPNVHITLETIKEASSLIEEEYFLDFMAIVLSSPKLLVYVATGIRPMYFNPDIAKDTEMMLKFMDTVAPYIRAYEGGLLKTAYLKANETDDHVVFAIINTEAQLLTLDEAAEYVEKQYPGGEEAVEVYFDYVLEKDVSVLYVNEKEDQSWYEVIHEDYEKKLFDKWHI